MLQQAMQTHFTTREAASNLQDCCSLLPDVRFAMVVTGAL
jgi:hypothetical protein